MGSKRLQKLEPLSSSGFSVFDFAHDRDGNYGENDQLSGGDEAAHKLFEILEEKKRDRTIAILDSRTYGIDVLAKSAVAGFAFEHFPPLRSK